MGSPPDRPWFRDPRSGPMRLAAACVLVLLVAAAGWVVAVLVGRLAVVVIPVAVALLLAALFGPAVDRLTRVGVPRALAAGIVLVMGTGLLATALTLITSAIANGLPDLRVQLLDGYGQLRDWLGRVAGVSGDQLDGLLREATTWFSRDRQDVIAGAWGALTTAGAVVTGVALALFLLVFLVHDGRRMWSFLLRAFPERARDRADRAGRRLFHDLGSYLRATAVIAAVDAVGIGLGLWVVDVPLVLPLAGLVFFGAFVPLVGAFVSGMAAALVALVAKGPVVALVVVGIVVLVQQLEGNVLEPLLMSSAVKLHPVAVVLAIAVGVDQVGIAGALLAVPVLTAARAVLDGLRADRVPDPSDQEEE